MDPSAILNQLYELGFRVDDSEEVGYTFSFEGLNLLYSPDHDDERYLCIMAPGIYRIDDPKERRYILEVMNEVNRRVKYAKIYAYSDFLIVSYESYISEGENLEDKVRTAILSIMASNEKFCRIINGEEKFEYEQEGDDEGDDDDIPDNHIDLDTEGLTDEELNSLLDDMLTKKYNTADLNIDVADDTTGAEESTDKPEDAAENGDNKENEIK